MIVFAVFSLNVAPGIGNFTSSCPTGYNLLSCGNDNTQKLTVEVYRRIKPFDSKTCHCYDYYGMSCVAWCTTLPIQGFEIRTQYVIANSIILSCTVGKLALGCHISSGFNPGYEKWRQTYPVNSGSSCFCYDYFGADCSATCGSVTNYEIVSRYSTNTFSVSCSNPNFRVLGCGINPYTSTGIETFRTVRVIGPTSCQCYDYFGTTCYAICGQIW